MSNVLKPLEKNSDGSISYLTKSQKAENRKKFLALAGVEDKINSMSKSLNVSVDEILYAIEKETAGSYSSQQQNLGGGKALGLIQFLGTGRDKGKGGKTINGKFYKYEDLKNMSTLEQLDVVDEYFNENFKSKNGKPGQLYLSISAPAYVGKKGDKVVYSAGSAEANQNAGWQNSDGAVTVDSLAAFGGKPEFFDYTPKTNVPTEEQASEDARYARNNTPRLDEAKDFIKQWKEIQNSDRVDKDRALRELAETHPGFKYTIPNYVKGKASGHTGGLYPKFFTEGYTEKNQRLLKYNSINDINRFINDSEDAILKQADAADQISIGVKPSLVLKDVPDNIVVGKDEKNNIPATKENLSPTPVIGEDNKVENFVELPEEIDTVEDETDFMGPDGKFYPYQIVKPGQEDEITTTGLLDADQGDELLKPSDDIMAEYEKWLADNPDGTFDEFNQKHKYSEYDKGGKTYFDLRGEGAFEESFLDKMGGLSSLIGLATGAIGLGAALKDVDIPKDPKLGPAFQQRLAESKRMAQQGLTPSELAKAHNDLDSSYATGIDNIVRGSAGNRAQFLAGLGGLDVARQSALMDIAVADAQMQRQNQEKYDSMMLMNEQYEAARQAKYQDAKFQQDTARQAAGAALAGSSISMVADAIASRQTNRYNKMKTEQLLMQMGYKATKDGKSGQPKVGDGVQTSFSIFDNNDKGPDFNLLDADDQAVNTDVSNQPKNQNTGNNLINTSPLNTSSGLINTDNEIDLGTQMYDIFNTQY